MMVPQQFPLIPPIILLLAALSTSAPVLGVSPPSQQALHFFQQTEEAIVPAPPEEYALGLLAIEPPQQGKTVHSASLLFPNINAESVSSVFLQSDDTAPWQPVPAGIHVRIIPYQEGFKVGTMVFMETTRENAAQWNGASIKLELNKDFQPRSVNKGRGAIISQGWKTGYLTNQVIRVADSDFAGSPVSQIQPSYRGNDIPGYTLPDDSRLLYARNDPSVYDNRDYVQFRQVSGTATEMLSRDAFTTLTPENQETSHQLNKVFDDDNVYVRLSPAAPGGRLKMTWVIYPSGGIPGSLNVDLQLNDYLIDINGEISYELFGLTQSVATDPDHHGELTIDGDALPLIEWEGRTQANGIQPFQFSSLGVRNTVMLTHKVATNSPTVASGADSQMLDRVSLRYDAYPRVDENIHRTLRLNTSLTPRLVSVGGFPVGTVAQDVIALDITDPESPIYLTNLNTFTDNSGTVAVEFEAPVGQNDFFLQLLNDAGTGDLTATVPLADVNTVPGGTLRRLYVVHDDILSTLSPLLNHRGAGTLILDPQAAYDAFSFGRMSPDALRDAMAYLIDSASDRVDYPAILLFGYTSFDPRNELGNYSGNQIPAFFENSVTTTLGQLEVTADYAYSALLGTDNLPDARVGRVPYRSLTDVQNFVARQIAYESNTTFVSDSGRGALLVSDNQSEFLADQNYWASLWAATGRGSSKINSDDNDGTSERASILSGLESGSGSALVLYNGHGNSNRWGTTTIFSNTEIQAANTNLKWPIVATFTCLNGYYAFPGAGPSFAELWMFLDSAKGAVANISPVGVDTYGNQSSFTQRVLEAYSTPGITTIGGVLRAAQSSYAIDFPTNTATLQAFILFGDPETPIFPSSGSGVKDFMLLN